MSLRSTMLAGVILPFTLAACGGGQDEAPDGSTDTGTETSEPVGSSAPQETTAATEERPAAIAQCIACHSFEKDGQTKIGPNLWGVYGQPAASKSGYAYSNALRGAGLIWDDATLGAYLENPRTTVPGGKMSYAGMRDEQQRAETIDYLKSLSDSE